MKHLRQYIRQILLEDRDADRQPFVQDLLNNPNFNGKKAPPLVSIIMNCLNGERFLKSALDSVYKQTINDWEIIFLDNFSIDQSRNIAKSYKEKLKYFKTF